MFFLKDGLLCGTDDLAVATDVLKRWDGKQTDNLSSQHAYKNVMGRCQAAAGELKPHVRWFIDPLGFAEAMRIGDEKKMKTLKMLRNQGFGAIQGLGGYRELCDGRLRDPAPHGDLCAAALRKGHADALVPQSSRRAAAGLGAPQPGHVHHAAVRHQERL